MSTAVLPQTTNTWGPLLRRLARWAGLALVASYVLGVAGGYLFLRFGREMPDVRLGDVALLRVAEIRRTLARQHFRQAKAAWDAKDYQQAYVYYTSAVARDPDNLAGRREAARFLGALGATNLEVNLLEEGLARHRDDPELNEMLFSRLLAAGRQRHALDLLHGAHAGALSGPAAAYLRTVELQATLASLGADAARALLDRRPELQHQRQARPVAAQVLWSTGARPEAIALMAEQVSAQPADLEPRLVLADWRRETGEEQAAIDVAVETVKQFPQEPAARVLLLDVGARRIRGTPDWWREVGFYLRDFGAAPKAVFLLAELGGRRGWLDLTRTLYELGARRGHDLGMLALFHSDALVRTGAVREGGAVLEQVEQQSAERNGPFLQQLRQREIAVAAALNDRDGVREYARRLASLLRSDTDLVEQFRQHYVRLGLADAAAEFAEKKPRAVSSPKRAGS